MKEKGESESLLTLGPLPNRQSYLVWLFLHHILIQPRHGNGNKNTAEKLFEKVLFGMPVVQYKNARMFKMIQS